MIAKGLRFFIRISIVPRQYNLSDDPFRKNLLSYLFVTEALGMELENLSPAAAAYLEQRKFLSITVDTAVFSVYVQLSKCLSKVYGDSANLVYLNDALVARGITSLYEDMSRGDVPSLSVLPPAEAMMLRKIRETMMESADKEKEKLEAFANENPSTVN